MNSNDGKVVKGDTYNAIRSFCESRKYKCKGCMYSIDKLTPNHSEYQTCIFENCPCSWEDEVPTTNTAIICPRCGSSEYIKSFEKDWRITNSEFEYKCINCNTYFGRRSLNEQ